MEEAIQHREMLIIPVQLIPRRKFLLAQLQERFPYKTSADIEYCRRQTQAGQKFSLDSFERRAHRFRIRHVSADSYSFPARLVDLVHDGIIAFGLAGEKNNGIRRSKFSCERCTGAFQSSMNGYGSNWIGTDTPGPTPAMTA